MRISTTTFGISRYLATAVLTLAIPAGAQTARWSVRWQPAKLVNGAPLAVRITSPGKLQSLSGEWLGHQVFFSGDPNGKSWSGLAGVSLETKPGVYTLKLHGTTTSGTEISFEQRIPVRAARYPSVAVKVASKFTAPSPEQLKQISEDKTLKAKTFSEASPERVWSGKFEPPVEAPVSDVFGTRRTFNDKTQSTHQGLDFAVPSGTPVHAINSGTVLLARPLYFEGNCVVVDHGQGLLTLYLHLSEFKVKEGEAIKRGQEIGLSGGTGRASGPHLHVAVRWEGVYLNPAELMKLNLP